MQHDSGPYTARLAESAEDLLACQTLRHLSFFGGQGIDADVFDASCEHVMVIDTADRVMCTARVRFTTAQDCQSGYTGQFYDLSPLASFRGCVMELGRICVDPAVTDPRILRLAWGALTAISDAQNVSLIFGCSSFPGLSPIPHQQSFRRLASRYLAPGDLGSFRKAPDAIAFSHLCTPLDRQSPMPPLLRTYLSMGGWVSDHAVKDRQMNTLHVLTGLETAKVPAARAKALRVLGAASGILCQGTRLAG